MEIFLLWLITIQGFFIMYFEYDVWRMNKDRFLERKKWREEKQKQKLKKMEATSGGPGEQKPE